MSNHLQKRLEKTKRKQLVAQYRPKPPAEYGPPQPVSVLSVLRELYGSNEFISLRAESTLHMLRTYRRSLSSRGVHKLRRLEAFRDKYGVNVMKRVLYAMY